MSQVWKLAAKPIAFAGGRASAGRLIGRGPPCRSSGAMRIELRLLFAPLGRATWLVADRPESNEDDRI